MNDIAKPSPAPTTRRLATRDKLRHMRVWWQLASAFIEASTDRLIGITAGIEEHPDDSQNAQYILPQKLEQLDEAPGSRPPDWGSVVVALENARRAVNSAIDIGSKAKEGNSDAVQQLKGATEGAERALCTALTVARTAYARSGGPENDLSFDLLNEDGDPPCVPMNQMNVSVRVKAAAHGYESGSLQADAMWNGADSAFDALNRAGHAVTFTNEAALLRERRNVYEGGDSEQFAGTQCRVSAQGRDWWVRCSDVVRV